MLTIKVFGSTPPCARCKEVEKRAKRIAERYPGQVEVEKLDAISEEGRKYGVMFPPAVVISDKVVVAGEVISESKLEDTIREGLEGKL